MTDLPSLTARIVALEEWRSDVDDYLDATDAARSDTADQSTFDPAAAALDAERLISWVHRHVAAVIARPLRGEIRWCPLWWEHAEAVFRFEALRRAWTHLAPDPELGMSLWIRDHLDPCLRELLSPLGPFADCNHDDRFHRHSEHTPLPTLPTAPPGA